MMTEIALVADLHGNWPATEALDRDLRARGIEKIWCLGDVIGKGPSSDRTFDWAESRCEFILQGNWEEGIGEMLFPNDDFYYRQLGERRMKALCQLPMEYSCYISGRKMRLLHGRPFLPYAVQTYGEEEFLTALFEPDYDVVGYADVHRQGTRVLAHKGLLFNTGSVGNGIGVPMVQYAILRGELESKTLSPLDITMVTVPYDREQAVRDAEDAGRRGQPNADLFKKEIITGVYSR
ncbi:MAG: metallophosphoesterase family protein [Clostridiales bacterium]|nr:metallophosphoesterase family protein [Clostridiales bacterium]